MADNRTRKKHTGEPGNGGQYGSHPRSGDHVTLNDRSAREPLPQLHMQPHNYTVMHFVHNREKFDLNPPYQRDDVWDGDRRRNLIRSMLLGVPTGSVILNARGYDTEVAYAVVDGKQRIETLRKFVDGEFSVPAWWFEAQSKADGFTGDELQFADLSPIGVRRFHNTGVSTIISAVESIEDEAEVYLLVNTSGVGQADSDLERAQHIQDGGAQPL